MEAKEEIYLYIKEHCEKKGVTALEVSKIFDIKRNVASHYLNRLTEDGKLRKGSTRPVCFFLEDSIDKRAKKEQSVFAEFVGYDGTIKSEIEKCKAAVSYPTNGLPMIICGASGVGKSYLASLIHKYAAEAGVIKKTAPFVVLNCADYANNSELLSSVLFGHVKGAFTGANEEKRGLLAEADGGYLFLDEVHNLSAENQEKLFIFIDSQKYRMLGDSKNWQQANVRLLFATTEDIHSTLLATFRRRIPLEIRIPDFLERSYGERFLLVSRFFQNEAEILQKNLHVDSTLFQSLMNLHAEGNIGTIKSEIKVLCAKAYSVQSGEELCIGNVKEQLMRDEKKWKKYYFSYNKNEVTEKTSPYRLFREITQMFTNGMSVVEIEDTLPHFYEEILERIKYYLGTEEEFQSLIPFSHIAEKCDRTVNPIIKRYGYQLSGLEIRELHKLLVAFLFDEQIHYVSFKISAYEKKKFHKFEVIVEKLFEELLEDENRNIREMLQIILTVWLSGKIQLKSKVNALILMHGERSASSVAWLTNEMIGSYVYEAFDMPVTVHTGELIEKVNDYVKDIETGEGLVILVDMGSLEQMYDKISGNIDGDLVIINNVSTALALDIGFLLARKESIYQITQTDLSPFYVKMQYYKGLSQKPNIVVSCISGEGIAVEIKENLKKYIDTDKIDILTMDYTELKTQLKRGEAEVFHNTLLVFTTTALSSSLVSIVNVEDIVNGFANPSISESILDKASFKEFTNDLIKLFTLKGVASRLRFLNPEVIMHEVDYVIRQYETYYHAELPNFLRINLFLHTSIMIERVLVKEESVKIANIDKNGIDEESKKFIEVSEDIFKKIMEKYKIEISEAEYLLLYQILQSIVSKEK